MRRTTNLIILMLLAAVTLTAMSDFHYDYNYREMESPDNEPFERLFEEYRTLEEITEDEKVELKVLYVQNSSEVDMDEINEKVNKALRKVEEATQDLDMQTGRRTVTVRINGESPDRPYMGVVSQDLTINQAAELGYNKFYGVLISRVSPNTPARAQRILPNDIIMEIDGQRMTNREILINFVDSYSVGETVKMKIFRNRQEIDMNFTFGSRSGTEHQVSAELTRAGKPKLSAGDGGLGWIPVWYTPETDDINALIEELGFSKIDEQGQFLNGFGLKGNIGNNLFLGGMIVGYTRENRTNPTGMNTDVIRRMKYNVRYGGITLEKRVPLSRKLITSVGSTLGWGRTLIEVSQNDGHYQWDTFGDDISDSNNNFINMSKGHIFLQPKVELYYRLNSWLSIRGEAGYIASYSYHSGWDATDSGDKYQVKGAPDTKFDGLTFTVGPWFGF